MSPSPRGYALLRYDRASLTSSSDAPFLPSLVINQVKGMSPSPRGYALLRYDRGAGGQGLGGGSGSSGGDIRYLLYLLGGRSFFKL